MREVDVAVALRQSVIRCKQGAQAVPHIRGDAVPGKGLFLFETGDLHVKALKPSFRLPPLQGDFQLHLGYKLRFVGFCRRLSIRHLGALKGDIEIWKQVVFGQPLVDPQLFHGKRDATHFRAGGQRLRQVGVDPVF